MPTFPLTPLSLRFFSVSRREAVIKEWRTVGATVQSGEWVRMNDPFKIPAQDTREP